MRATNGGVDPLAGTMSRTPAAKPVKRRPTNVITEVQGGGRGCAEVDGLDPQGIAAAYWFDAPDSPGSHAVTIRFTGRRIGVKGKPATGDAFDRIEKATGIAGGSGRVAITARVQGINAGEWRVTAVTASPVDKGRAWIGRLPDRVITTTSRLAPLAQGPAVRLAAWPALVGLGFVVTLVLQAALLARAGAAVLPVLATSLIAGVLGYLGGKAYYLVLHRKHPRHFLKTGACIQGFLIVAFGVLAVAAALFAIPVGLVLDATTPGLFLGMALGRPGCFLTGCCAGRPTASRWGLRSSDRRLVTRRIPVQLIEAGAALVIGAVTLALLLTIRPPIDGAIFVGALAAYTLIRQVLFTFRTDSRTPRGRNVTMALAGLALVASIAAPVLA